MKSQRKQSVSARSSLGTDELRKIDAWWRAANYLSVGMLYLAANPLLRQPLKPEHTSTACSAIGAPTPARAS